MAKKAWTQRIPTWLAGLMLTLLPGVLAAFGAYLIVFSVSRTGVMLVWLSGVSILAIAAGIGRSLGPVIVSVYGAGIFLIFVFMAGPAFVQSVILQSRGQTVQARVERIVTDPSYPASTDDGCRSCSHTHGYVFRQSDGQIVKGYPYGTAKNLHIGDTRPVVTDAEGRVDSRSPQEIQPIQNGTFLAAAAAIAFGICFLSVQAARKRSKA